MKKILGIGLLLLAVRLDASIPVTAVYEIRQTGTAGNVNAGIYDSVTAGASGTDLSQQDNFASSGTVLSTADGLGITSCTVTAAGYTWGPEYVGNGLHVTAGAGFIIVSSSSWHVILSTGVNSLGITGPCTTPTNSVSNGTFYIGGANSLNSTTDQDLFASAGATNGTGAGKFWIKAGTLTIGEAVSGAQNGGTNAPIVVEGYNTLRGDAPTGSSRPVLSIGNTSWVTGNDWFFLNLSATGIAAQLFSTNNTRFINCDLLNNSTTAGRSTVGVSNATRADFTNCSFMSERGPAISAAGGAAVIELIGCHVHHSSNAVNGGVTTGQIVSVGSTFNSFLGNAFNLTSGHTVEDYLINNTIYGSASPFNSGYFSTTGSSRIGHFVGNIWYGFTKAINITDAQFQDISRDQDFFNNTTNTVNFSTSTTDLFVDPQFRNVVSRSGTTATTTAGNHLVQSGATFQTWGITTSDIVCIRAGTGITIGCYTLTSIDSETQVTTTEVLSANATGDKSWEIVQGNDFTPGINARGVGFPGLSSDGIYTSYNDIGGIQHRDAPRAYAQ